MSGVVWARLRFPDGSLVRYQVFIVRGAPIDRFSISTSDEHDGIREGGYVLAADQHEGVPVYDYEPLTR